MSIWEALSNLLIGPLELFFEIIFALVNQIVNDPGISIIFLSLAVNFLVLPLYRQADKMQDEERETEKRLGHWVRHIKKTFTGDERYMMLQTYYRQNHYKPSYALRGSVSLLLEIPFFIAAYNFLSTLPILEGVSFGPIRDLGVPDAMFTIGNFDVNVLPILMTVINIISSVIYTKGLPTKSKVQLYVMAGLFLVLLYDSPAGLVFYWTLNNLFSLIKNIFVKMKHSNLVLSLLCAIFGWVLLVLEFTSKPWETVEQENMAAVSAILLQLPILIYLLKRRVHFRKLSPATSMDAGVFRCGAIFLTVLLGVLIPSTVIHSSPEEFINTVTLENPLWYVAHSALLAAGTFLIWFGMFYVLAGPGGKKTMGLGLLGLSGLAVLNYMFFGKNFGTLSPDLNYIVGPYASVGENFLNGGVLLLGILVLFVLWKKKRELSKILLLASIVAAVGMSVVNLHTANTAIQEKLVKLAQQGSTGEIPLSKTGKNVVLLMMDRGISGYVPYIMNEKPELLEQFDGFTYYPNTISFGAHTNFGSPALYGGYEYTPKEMNKRDKESLESKQNEALKVLPVLFSREKYAVTVCDPSYAGYQWIPDVSIYRDYPDIHAFNTIGKYSENPAERAEQSTRRLNRNFFCYSLLKSSPLFMQPMWYNDGQYNEIEKAPRVQIRENSHKATGINERFMDSYMVLKSLPDMTRITEEAQGAFLMMSNESTHAPMLLQEPEYVPSEVVDNTAYDQSHRDRFLLEGHSIRMETGTQVMHYQVNMASALQLGQWFDFLRENGVYDNTRIILVSDHGSALDQFPGLDFDHLNGEEPMFYNPILMVKDFDSTGFTTDPTFMTNADVPTLALSGLLENPVNPFTQKPITSDPKFSGPQYICTSHQWSTNVNNGNTFLPDGWISVEDDIFDPDNWTLVEKNR